MVKELAIAVAILAVGNAGVAVSSASSWAGRALLFGGLMLGPLAGWTEVIAEGQLLGALWLLVPTSICVLGPALVYTRNGSLAALGLATLFWFASGWLFVIGLWV